MGILLKEPCVHSNADGSHLVDSEYSELAIFSHIFFLTKMRFGRQLASFGSRCVGIYKQNQKGFV